MSLISFIAFKHILLISLNSKKPGAWNFGGILRRGVENGGRGALFCDLEIRHRKTYKPNVKLFHLLSIYCIQSIQLILLHCKCCLFQRYWTKSC